MHIYTHFLLPIVCHQHVPQYKGGTFCRSLPLYAVPYGRYRTQYRMCHRKATSKYINGRPIPSKWLSSNAPAHKK